MVGSYNYKDSRSPYSKTVDSFLANYFHAMKNAPSPKEVSKAILEAIGNSPKYPYFLSRYTVGKDAKALARIKKNSTDQGLHEFISKRLLQT